MPIFDMIFNKPALIDFLNLSIQFSKSNFTEKSEKFNLSKLILETVKKYENPNILIEQQDEIYFNGRKNLIQRCINNLIDNAIKFGDKVNIELSKNNNTIDHEI